MKKLFGLVFLLLCIASWFTWRSLPETSSDAPVIYWVTDANPARAEQIRTFRKWLRDNGHPDIEVRVDTVNMTAEKLLVQGVSGVAGDLLDHTGGANMRFRQAVGMLEDVTDWAREMGFDVSKTYPVLETELTVDGRQFAFPSNAGTDAYWVNVEAFERLGMEPPPKQWTFDEFERIGKEFVRRANEGGGPQQRCFFAPDVDLRILARTTGGATYNETQTACVLDSEGYRRVLRLRHKWMYEDRLLPTAADRGNFASVAGYGGTGFALFAQGNFALVRSGRHALISFRKYTDDRRAAGRPAMKLAVSEDPHGDFRCNMNYTRATAVYAAGKNKEHAKYFMAYLASDEYNMNIVMDADSLPPNPEATKTEAFLRPPDRPEEWQHPWGSVHEIFANLMTELGIAPEFSPFVLGNVADRFVADSIEKYMNNMVTVEKATSDMQRLINDELERSLNENPSLRPEYERRLAVQKQIDGLRARGEKVPLSWISNPYWRYYYTLHNLADETK